MKHIIGYLLPRTVALVFICAASYSFAHEDALLYSSTSPEMNQFSQLPDQYQPAGFDSEKLSLTVGDKTLVFPDCLRAYFEDGSQVTITSSWYHMNSGSGLPPYISFKVEIPARGLGYGLMFNLDSLHPIDFTVTVSQPNNQSIGATIALNHTSCDTRIKGGVTRVAGN